MAFLEQGTAEAPADAILWSDLAAAHLGRAEQGFLEESIQALSAAQRAVTIDGSLLEARFNLALALEQNSLIHQARQAWSEYLEVEEDRGWKSEARAHQRQLNEPSGLTRWERLRPKLDAAASRGDKEAVQKIVAGFSYRARAHAEGDLLPQWAEAVKAGQDEQAARTLRITREIGEAVASASDEHMIADSIVAIERITGSQSREALTSLAAAYRAQAEGSSLCLDNQGLKGEVPLLKARQAFALVGSPGTLSAFYHLAVCAYQRGEPQAALSRLGTLLRQPGMDRYPNLVGRAHWMAGLSSMVLANPGLAQESYQKALQVFEGLGSIPEIGGTCDLLADNQLYLGDRRQAWRFHQRGLALAAAEGDPRRLFTALDKAADTAANEGLFEEALRFRDEVVQITKAGTDPPGAAHAFLRRGEVRFRLGRKEQALQDLAKAEQACARIPDSAERSRRRADIFLIEGKIRAVTRPASAFPYLTRALEMYQKDEFRYPLVEIYLTRARVLLAMSQPLAAERDLRSGIEEFERQRDQVRSEELRIAYFEQARNLFDLLIELQVGRPGGAEEAFATAERQRARVLLDRLKLASSGGADSRDVGLLTMSEAQSRLPDGVTLISYESLPTRLLVWVLRKDKEPAIQEISLPAATLEKRIAAFLRNIESRADDKALQDHLTALHRDILAPALPYTRPGDLLVFVPDRSLHRLPFAALRDPESGRYLVEDHASEVVPSASLYLSKAVRPSGVTKPDLLVIANPRFDRQRFEGLPDLSGALAEAAALSGLLGTGVAVLKEEEATREAFIKDAGRYAFVHLATHALLNSDHPHLSSLLLATDGTDDRGILTASEISNLSFLQTELVYLGACQSGAGAIATEGVLSLARAFLAAGVPRVVSSLWDVDDAATTRFSLRFYGSLLRRESPEEALRIAQLAAIHSADEIETSLRHWAAFQVSGARTSHSEKEE